MGVFSSKTRINVFSEAFPLADEDIDPVKDVVAAAILTGNDLVTGVISNALYNPSMQVEPMLNYAKDYYTLGLAGAADHITEILDPAAIAAAITLDLSLTYGALIDYNYITNLTVDHIALPFLVNQRAYNTLLNTIGTLPPGLLLPTKHLGNTIGNKVVIEEVTLDSDLVTIRIKYKISSWFHVITGYDPITRTLSSLPDTFYEETITVNPGLRIGHAYCVAKYFVLDAGLQAIQTNNWWFYDINSGLHPALNTTHTLTGDNLFFPVVPIRYNNVDYTDVSKHSTDLYITSKTLLKKAGMDIDQLGGLINDNPDVGEIDHAYTMWGVDLQTTKNESIRYLVEFFDYLADAAVIEQNDYVNFILNDEVIKETTYSFNGLSLTAPSGVTTTTVYPDNIDGDNLKPYNVVTVNDTSAASLVEHGLDTSVTYAFITSHFVNGSIGVKGTATMTKERPTLATYSRGDSRYKNIDNSRLILRHQVSANVYKEVVVVGLKHTNRIYGEFSVITELHDIIDDPDNHNFLIPIHYGISKRLPLTVRAILYVSSAHIVINGKVETKVRWYEKGIFKFILFAASVYLAVIAGQWYLVPLMFAGKAAELAGMQELALIIAAITIVVGGYNINVAEIGKIVVRDAIYYLKMTSCLVELASMPSQLKLLEIQGEFEDLAVEQREAMEVLEAAQTALDTKSFLDPMLLVDNVTLSLPRLESPDAFYNRTLNNNPGVITLNVIENYHDALLTLPTADGSVGLV